MPNARASKQSKPYKNKYSNLPQEVVHQSYPKRNYAIKDNGYPDDINLMDANDKRNASKISRHLRGGK